MEKRIKKYNIFCAILVFIGIPILIYTLGDTPRRTVLKESISILTILAFFMMLGQFYLARSNRTILKVHKMVRVVKLHKIIGYIFVSILLLHPILIIVPRYYESGIDPKEAFITMLTTLDSIGLMLGIIAWCLMLILGITSIFRNKLGIKYTTWRIFHGILSILFIVFATWHAIDLGRHTDKYMSLFMIIVASVGVLLLLNTYFFKSKKRLEVNNG